MDTEQTGSAGTAAREILRHTFTLEFLTRKLEEYRDLASKLCVRPGAEGDPQVGAAIQALSKALGYFTEAAGGTPKSSPAVESPRGRLAQSFASALTALARLDPDGARRRVHDTSFDRCRGEILSTALTRIAVKFAVLVDCVDRVDPGARALLFEGRPGDEGPPGA